MNTKPMNPASRLFPEASAAAIAAADARCSSAPASWTYVPPTTDDVVWYSGQTAAELRDLYLARIAPLPRDAVLTADDWALLDTYDARIADADNEPAPENDDEGDFRPRILIDRTR